MFNKQLYISRRDQLKKRVGNGVIFLPGNEQSSMSYKDNWYPFRQDSSFLYFTGLDIPSLTFIIDIDNNTETLFGQELTVDDLIWNGHQPSLNDLAAQAGISTTKSSLGLEKYLKNVQAKKQLLHFLPPYRPEHNYKIDFLFNMRGAAQKAMASVSLIKAIVALRSIKEAEEIVEIKKAVAITEEMHLVALRSAKEGNTEASVAGAVHGVSISAGGNLSFPTILTTRGEILHNHYTNNTLPPGKLVLCDCGAETAMHYAGDLTRTFPVNATFSALQKEVYNIVLAAQQAAVASLKPKQLYKDTHFIACEKLAEGLKQIGLMKGDIKEAVAAGAHTLFFQCGLGHMMGLDVHDMENLGEEYVGYSDTVKKSTAFGLKSLRLGKPLEAGFVLTVEPGLYFIPELMDLWAADKKHTEFINYNKLEGFRDFGGIRIEDNFLITDDGSELLSTSLPRTAADIETLRASS